MIGSVIKSTNPFSSALIHGLNIDSSCSQRSLRSSDSDSIFHIRLLDFELQVERLLDAGLRTRPLAIISSHHQNGTIVSASAEALTEGLYPGLKVALARKMSHSVMFLPYNASLYARVHQYIYQTVTRYSPVIEPTVYGQYFADLSGMRGIYRDNLNAGYLLAKDIRNKVNLRSQIGISINKLVSQIATAVVPETIYRVPAGDESNFLAPLNTEVLPVSAEPAINKLMHFLLLRQVRQVQAVTADAEASPVLFGKYHRRLYQEARGQDNSPVKPPHKADRLSEQTVLTADTNDEAQLLTAGRHLAEQLAYQLRRRRQIAKTLNFEIHYTDGFKSNRKGTLTANDNATAIAEVSRLFRLANYRRNRVRAIILEAADFLPVINQLDLFRPPKDDRLSRSLDQIRQRYGFTSIGNAAGLIATRSYPEDAQSNTEILLKLKSIGNSPCAAG